LIISFLWPRRLLKKQRNNMKNKTKKITRAMRARWGRKGGLGCSRKKLLAIRRNGKKGGRPKKQPEVSS
jgi:hypothetical protein